MNTTPLLKLMNTTINPSLALEWSLSHVNAHIFQVNLIPSFVYVWVLLVTGILGNSLVCYVYHFKQSAKNKKLSSNIFILALSWFDLCNVVCSMPFELALIYNFVQFDHPVLCKLSRFVTFFCNNSTSVILLAIAIDRLRGILSGARLLRLKSSTAKGIIGIAMFVSVSISWPMLLFFGTLEFPIPNGIVGHTCLIDNKYINSSEVTVFTIALLILHLCFDLSFIILYSIIGKRVYYDSDVTKRLSESSERFNSLKKQSRKGSDSSNDDDVFITSQIHTSTLKDDNSSTTLLAVSTNSSSQSIYNGDKFREQSLYVNFLRRADSLRTSFKMHASQSRVSRPSQTSEWRMFNRRRPVSRTSFMLFLVTVAYIITYLPYCVLVVYRTVDPGFFEKLNDLEKTFYHLSLRSYLIGSAINPIIYSFVNPRFRRMCRSALNDLFCCKKCKT